ncbi:MAG: hypothetical protein HRT35_24125 [Algicola sp.]|nr:hypothetical protein [Algicola sp.]
MYTQIKKPISERKKFFTRLSAGDRLGKISNMVGEDKVIMKYRSAKPKAIGNELDRKFKMSTPCNFEHVNNGKGVKYNPEGGGVVQLAWYDYIAPIITTVTGIGCTILGGFWVGAESHDKTSGGYLEANSALFFGGIITAIAGLTSIFTTYKNNASTEDAAQAVNNQLDDIESAIKSLDKVKLRAEVDEIAVQLGTTKREATVLQNKVEATAITKQELMEMIKIFKKKDKTNITVSAFNDMANEFMQELDVKYMTL